MRKGLKFNRLSKMTFVTLSIFVSASLNAQTFRCFIDRELFATIAIGSIERSEGRTIEVCIEEGLPSYPDGAPCLRYGNQDQIRFVRRGTYHVKHNEMERMGTFESSSNYMNKNDSGAYQPTGYVGSLKLSNFGKGCTDNRGQVRFEKTLVMDYRTFENQLHVAIYNGCSAIPQFTVCNL